MQGHTNNPNGRPKGVPNRLTKELRSLLKDVIAGEIERLPEYFAELKPKERVELLAKILPYAMPRMEAASYTVGEPFNPRSGIFDD
jgi:hypothetical protein